MIYFTSDLHFLHKNIIKYANRPFEFSTDGLVQCTKTIFENYNDIVTNDDIVFFLGDLILLKNNTINQGKKLLKLMKGKKILIKGNHDIYKDSFYKECGFKKIFNHLILGEIFLSHYPLFKYKYNILEREQLKLFKENNCKILIHGHIHNKESPNEDNIKRENVCVDFFKNNFKPVHFKQYENYLNKELEKLKWEEIR